MKSFAFKACIICSFFIAFSTTLYGAKKVPVQYSSDDKPAEEILKEVSQTRQELILGVNGIKIKKPKDPRQGLYALMSIGMVYTPSLGTSSALGTEIGYDFIFGSNHSLRVFGFFDRTNYGAFMDLEFDRTKPSAQQIYRAGLSAEYRIYINPYIGFRIRLASFGSFNLSRTSDNIIPILTSKRDKWLYPTFAFGPIFSYGKRHELFIGYDLLDYEKRRGMSINYLKYSYRF